MSDVTKISIAVRSAAETFFRLRPSSLCAPKKLRLKRRLAGREGGDCATGTLLLQSDIWFQLTPSCRLEALKKGHAPGFHLLMKADWGCSTLPVKAEA